MSNKISHDQIELQWVILAAGKGTRIDPSSRLDKNFDIWIGEENVLQMSMKFLPKTHPHIVVISPQMAKRIEQLSDDRLEKLIGKNLIFCVQPEPNGTGGALRSALHVIEKSDAEFIGVAFGDEPFLDAKMFTETIESHFKTSADITLCGKIPETVVDKGGLFFDHENRLIGTKEWYDMTESEKSEMRDRLDRGKAITNTGITIVRRQAMIERIDRLELHKNGTEFHHVDLIRHFYDDGLKTNAHIHREPIISGVNRWANVLIGERDIFERNRDRLSRNGVRVDPNAQITIGENVEIGNGCHFVGRVQIGENVKIGSYVKLENVILTGVTEIGDLVGLKNVVAIDTIFDPNPIGETVAKQIFGLELKTKISDCEFDSMIVGSGVDLRNIDAHATVIPPKISLSHKTIGVPKVKDLWWRADLIPQNYKAGIFAFGEMHGKPDWENLRKHVRSHSENELIARSTVSPKFSKIAIDCVSRLLDHRRSDGSYVSDQFTSEEIWGGIFEMVKLCTGKLDPYREDKCNARETAIELISQFPDLDWKKRLKLTIAGNVIDYSSPRVLKRISENGDYFRNALNAAIETDLSIDHFDQFSDRVINAEKQRIVWMIDNDGESIFDLWLIEKIAELGHKITIVGKPIPASNDSTVDDLRETIEYDLFKNLRRFVRFGQIDFIASGSNTIGTNLNQATDQFANALIDSDLVISKGQGNFFTTQGLKKDRFYLLLSKGTTAERATGVIANPDLPIDGMILMFQKGSNL